MFYDLQISSDAIYMLCINCMGLYFRFMNEILKRRTFLDRRECVKSTLYLKHEEDQEVRFTNYKRKYITIFLFIVHLIYY